MDDTPLWLIVALVGVFVILLVLRLTRRAGGDMIERQRRETTGLMANTPPPNLDGDVAPDNQRSDIAAVMGVPEIRAAIAKGRKVEAVKLVRERTGLGLKEAKDIVDRAS